LEKKPKNVRPKRLWKKKNGGVIPKQKTKGTHLGTMGEAEYLNGKKRESYATWGEKKVEREHREQIPFCKRGPSPVGRTPSRPPEGEEKEKNAKTGRHPGRWWAKSIKKIPKKSGKKEKQKGGFELKVKAKKQTRRKKEGGLGWKKPYGREGKKKTKTFVIAKRGTFLPRIGTTSRKSPGGGGGRGL